MQTWQSSLHIELNKLPRLLYGGDSDVQDTTNIVWVLFSVNWEIKPSAYWPWVSKFSLFYSSEKVASGSYRLL